MRISASPETHVVSVAFYMRPSASGATGSTVGQQEHRWCGTVSVICCGAIRCRRSGSSTASTGTQQSRSPKSRMRKPARPDLWEPWADTAQGHPTATAVTSAPELGNHQGPSTNSSSSPAVMRLWCGFILAATAGEA